MTAGELYALKLFLDALDKLKPTASIEDLMTTAYNHVAAGFFTRQYDAVELYDEGDAEVSAADAWGD